MNRTQLVNENSNTSDLFSNTSHVNRMYALNDKDPISVTSPLNNSDANTAL